MLVRMNVVRYGSRIAHRKCLPLLRNAASNPTKDGSRSTDSCPITGTDNGTKCFSTTSPTTREHTKFRITTSSRHQEILDLLFNNFFTDEPMSKSLGLTEGATGRIKSCEDYALKGLEDNLSIMAIDPATDKILGVSINGPAYRYESKLPLEEKTFGMPEGDKFRHIIRVLHEVNSRTVNDIFNEADTDCLFDIKIVSTDKMNRKAGLGTELLAKSVELARVLGFKGCKTEATGAYSRKAFQRIGFDVKAEYHYTEYEDNNGVNIFQNIEKPHTCTTLMTKRL